MRADADLRRYSVGSVDPTPEAIRFLSLPTPIGRLYVAASEYGLVRIELPGPSAQLRLSVWLALHFPQASIRCGVSPILSKAASQLNGYFTAGLERFSLPLHFVGTEFQLSVWNEVERVGFAEVKTYREIALAVGRTRAVRAVGAAQGANPLPIVVPCHRIIGSDGRLTGYGGGLEIKRWLLDHEASKTERTTPVARRPLPLTDGHRLVLQPTAPSPPTRPRA